MKRLIALMLAIMMILAGCSKPNTKDLRQMIRPKHLDKAAKPQEYSTVYSGEITTLNYLVTANQNEFALAANFVDNLIDYDRYGEVPIPGLATEWESSEDGIIWTL